MKKTFLTITAVLGFFAMKAQAPEAFKGTLHKESRAMNDTLLYIPFPNVVVNTIDSSTFYVNTEDLDGLVPLNPGAPMDFMCFYSTNDTGSSSGYPIQNNFFHPWETPASMGGNDSAFFIEATSYFSPPGVADNWFELGPITIPSTGATLSWYDRTFAYRDGYEVLVSATGMLNYSDFTSPAIFSRADAGSPSPTYATDTTWQLRTAGIPASYNGQAIYIAFHHTANNMDVLLLDEITIIDSIPGAIGCTAAFTIVQDTSNLYNYTIYSSASVGSSYQYLWDFGDTTYSALAYPTHLYTGTGPYQICLFVQDTITGCSTYYCDSITPGMAMSLPTTITVVPAVTGISEQQDISSVELFPNPATDHCVLNVETPGNVEVSVFITDLLGNRANVISRDKLKAGKNRIDLDTGNLSKGMYVVHLETGQKHFAKKLIIAR